MNDRLRQEQPGFKEWLDKNKSELTDIIDVPALSSAPAREQWQPIETAPKDGRCILAWRKHTTRPLITRWDQVYGEWENDDSGFHVYSITHWMPLPAAPGATAEPAPAREPMSKSAAAWAALTEPMIDEFLEDYEMVGESDDGRDACHVPNDGEKILIKDAVMGLLQEAWDSAASHHGICKE